jgi:predicted DsbA family dithiol-disulfide isomerase
MPNDSQDISPVFRIDVTQGASEPQIESGNDQHQATMSMLLEQLVVGQDRQNELLEEILEQLGSTQRQRAADLHNWKEANPVLARRCRAAAEALSQVQTEFLHNVTSEVQENHENMMDGEFVLNEFVDRYGPRLAHLNGVLQLLSQLSGKPAPQEH